MSRHGPDIKEECKGNTFSWHYWVSGGSSSTPSSSLLLPFTDLLLKKVPIHPLHLVENYYRPQHNSLWNIINTIKEKYLLIIHLIFCNTFHYNINIVSNKLSRYVISEYHPYIIHEGLKLRRLKRIRRTLWEVGIQFYIWSKLQKRRNI